MARSRIKVKVSLLGVRALMQSEGAQKAVTELAEATADACNSESSWGGYFHAATTDDTRARAKVWSADNRNDEARDQRLVRNLGGS